MRLFLAVLLSICCHSLYAAEQVRAIGYSAKDARIVSVCQSQTQPGNWALCGQPGDSQPGKYLNVIYQAQHQRLIAIGTPMSSGKSFVAACYALENNPTQSWRDCSPLEGSTVLAGYYRTLEKDDAGTIKVLGYDNAHNLLAACLKGDNTWENCGPLGTAQAADYDQLAYGQGIWRALGEGQEMDSSILACQSGSEKWNDCSGVFNPVSFTARDIVYDAYHKQWIVSGFEEDNTGKAVASTLCQSSLTSGWSHCDNQPLPNTFFTQNNFIAHDIASGESLLLLNDISSWSTSLLCRRDAGWEVCGQGTNTASGLFTQAIKASQGWIALGMSATRAHTQFHCLSADRTQWTSCGQWPTNEQLVGTLVVSPL